MITNAEIRRDIDHRVYHAWPENAGIELGDPRRCLSRSELMQMLDCPEMFLAGGRKPRSASISLGSLVDCMLLTPDRFEESYAIQPDHYLSAESKGRGKDKVTTVSKKPWTMASKTCKEWVAKARERGQETITEAQWAEADAMAHAVRVKVVAGTSLGQLIDLCETQTVIVATWQCPDTGIRVPIRALPDMVRFTDAGPVCYDLKTSQEVRRWEFERSMRNYHYDVQAWMYSEMLASATGKETPFGFVTVRNTKPYLVATYRASMGTLAEGKAKFERAMSAYTKCLDSGKWPGYTEGFELI